MTNDLPAELSRLPTPQLIEPLSFSAIFTALLTDFQHRYPDYSALLASDPAIKLLEVAAYRELLLRHRINEAARANLLAFAADSDLDHLGAFYGVTRRLAGEPTRHCANASRPASWALPTPARNALPVLGLVRLAGNRRCRRRQPGSGPRAHQCAAQPGR